MAKRIAMTQLSSCWGCDQSLVDLHLGLLDVLPAIDIVFWPAVVDTKLHQLEAMKENSIHIGLVEGSCRTKEDEHLLKLMREKCKILVAWGSCSAFGGVQGLGNQWDLEELLERKFMKTETVTDPRIPNENVSGFTESIIPNGDIVPIDVVLPGCPPTSQNTLDALTALLTNQPWDLPTKTVCDQCPMERKEKIIKQFKRTHEGHIEPGICILDQGYLCLGFATIGLCGAQCPTVNTPCKGCFGPPPAVTDHGAKIISALGAVADMDPEELEKSFPDPIGSFYFTDYASSYLSKMRTKDRGQKK
ncbi:MAG: NADH-quinone oxidoreductase subunit B family protein [Candidatus Thorarchaeota archaeon]|jgi:F420-non-reducing hydrogenase small subunit